MIDVRAPLEYERGAFPGSVNLPLLTDSERHEVGAQFKKAGQDAAIALAKLPSAKKVISSNSRCRRNTREPRIASSGAPTTTPSA